jgi:PhnB protein
VSLGYERSMSNLRPHGHHTVTGSFIVPGTAKVIGFLEKVFDAKVVDRYDGPGNSVLHAEVLLGDTVIMCGEPMAGWEPTPAAFSYYASSAEAVDALYKRALQAGATSVNEPKRQPWGYHAGTVKDVGGNRWTICSVVEIVSREEILRRMSDMPKG